MEFDAPPEIAASGGGRRELGGGDQAARDKREGVWRACGAPRESCVFGIPRSPPLLSPCSKRGLKLQEQLELPLSVRQGGLRKWGYAVAVIVRVSAQVCNQRLPRQLVSRMCHRISLAC